MGLLTDILGLIDDLSGSTYIDEAKEWADDIWNNMRNKRSGTLYLSEIGGRLYKYLRIQFRGGNSAIFSEDNDRGCLAKYNLTKKQKKALEEEGYVTIIRYN